MNIHNQEWLDAEKMVDPDFEGSIFQQLGFDKEMCPTCKAHLRNGICLNGCHLTSDVLTKFNDMLAKLH